MPYLYPTWGAGDRVDHDETATSPHTKTDNADTSHAQLTTLHERDEAKKGWEDIGQGMVILEDSSPFISYGGEQWITDHTG